MVTAAIDSPDRRVRRQAEGAIAVLGHYGAGNLGDEAIIAAVVHELRRRRPGRALVGVSMNPADTAARHGMPAWPLRWTARSGPSDTGAEAVSATAPTEAPATPAAASGRAWLPVRILRRLARSVWLPVRSVAAELAFLARMARFCRRLDLLLVTGSNQFLDNFGGAAGFPWTLLKWTLAARLHGVPVAFVSVGAGPLDGRVSRSMIRLALRLSAWHSYRDAASCALVEGTGRDLGGSVEPDLAFALPLAPVAAASGVPLAATGRVVGINVMPVFDGRYWPIDRPDLYGRYVAAVAGFIGRLRAAGDRPFLYATQPSDERVIEDVLACLRNEGGIDAEADPEMVRRAATVDGLVALIRCADVLVPTRFHGTVLALVCHKPVLAVCYHRKTADVMAEFGLAAHALAFEAVTTAALADGLAAVCADADAIRARTAARAEANRARLAAQFDTVVALAERGRPLALGAQG